MLYVELDSIIQHVMLQLRDLEQGTEEHAVLSAILMVATTKERQCHPTTCGTQAFHFLTKAATPGRTCRWLSKELEKATT